MERLRILILVDIAQRDLPGYALLKEVLEAGYNAEVCLCRSLEPKTQAHLFRPHVVILPMVYVKGYQQLAYYFKSKGTFVVFLATEGYPIVVEDDYMDHLAGRYSDFRPIDLNLVWCQELADRVVRHRTMSADRVQVVGLPRFDFYHPSFSRLRMKRSDFNERHGLDPEFPTVTWASNFPGVILSAKEHQSGIEAGNFMHVRALRDAEKLLNNDVVGLRQTSENLIRWVGEYKKVNFVIRPHPQDDRATFIGFADRMKRRGVHRVAVVHEGPILDVLSASDILLQRGCTTAIEAALMGLPVIETRFNPEELYQDPSRDNCLDLATNYDEMKQALERYLVGGKIPPGQLERREKYVRRWFYKMDGLRTVEAADRMLEFCKSNPSPLDYRRSDFIRGIFTLILQRTLFWFRLRRIQRSYDTFITAPMVRRWTQRIRVSGIVPELLSRFKQEKNQGVQYGDQEKVIQR